VSAVGAAPSRRRYPAIILSEGGDQVAGAKSDPAPSRSADRDAAESMPTNRPRIARRPPSTGPVLPTVTDDERDVGWGETPEPDDDERLRREVPPHHGS
jgi:hypothetical protein